MTDDVFSGPLVSGPWLAAHLDEVVVVDVRWYLTGTGPHGRTGREAYAAGHVPGAVHLDIDTDLAAPATPTGGRHPLPSPEHFAAALGRAGIAAGTPVVAYDDTGGAQAARLWWMLHALGEPVAVLDGGLAAWPGALTTDPPSRPAVERTPRPWPPERFLDADAVQAGIGRGALAVFDARTAERYAHGDPAIDPRPGHVPGAHSAPWAGNLDDDGRFRDAAALQVRIAAAEGAPAWPTAAAGSPAVTTCWP